MGRDPRHIQRLPHLYMMIQLVCVHGAVDHINHYPLADRHQGRHLCDAKVGSQVCGEVNIRRRKHGVGILCGNLCKHGGKWLAGITPFGGKQYHQKIIRRDALIELCLTVYRHWPGRHWAGRH